MKTVGICGNTKRGNYDSFVESARMIYKVHDFADYVGVSTMEDLRDCEILFVFGKERELSEETWDIISWAYITGVVIVPVYNITATRIRFHAIKFLRTFANALEKGVQ